MKISSLIIAVALLFVGCSTKLTEANFKPQKTTIWRNYELDRIQTVKVGEAMIKVTKEKQEAEYTGYMKPSKDFTFNGTLKFKSSANFKVLGFYKGYMAIHHPSLKDVAFLVDTDGKLQNKVIRYSSDGEFVEVLWSYEYEPKDMIMQAQLIDESDRIVSTRSIIYDGMNDKSLLFTDRYSYYEDRPSFQNLKIVHNKERKQMKISDYLIDILYFDKDKIEYRVIED